MRGWCVSSRAQFWELFQVRNEIGTWIAHDNDDIVKVAFRSIEVRWIVIRLNCSIVGTGIPHRSKSSSIRGSFEVVRAPKIILKIKAQNIKKRYGALWPLPHVGLHNLAWRSRESGRNDRESHAHGAVRRSFPAHSRSTKSLLWPQTLLAITKYFSSGDKVVTQTNLLREAKSNFVTATKKLWWWLGTATNMRNKVNFVMLNFFSVHWLYAWDFDLNKWKTALGMFQQQMKGFNLLMFSGIFSSDQIS